MLPITEVTAEKECLHGDKRGRQWRKGGLREDDPANALVYYSSTISSFLPTTTTPPPPSSSSSH